MRRMAGPPYVIFSLISLMFQLSTHQNKSSYWKTAKIICPGVSFSKDPETSRDFFRVNFSGPGKFLKAPETPRILTRVFREVFPDLLRELDDDWFKEPEFTPLHWVGFLTYSPNQNIPRKITSKLQFLLSFAHFQQHLSYVARPLSGIKSLKKVWFKY